MFSHIKLKNYRQERKLSQTDIANYLDISRAAYSAWETGKRKPNQKHLKELASLFQISISEFEDQHPFMEKFHQLTPINQVKLEDYAEDLLMKQERKVTPLFPIQVKANIALSAGLGNGFFDDFETETVYTEEEFSGFDVATWITGDSMEPVYQSGEVALIRETGFDYDGAVYAVAWNDQVYIKKVYLEEDGFRLVSLNSDYSEKFAPASDHPKIVGKVIGHFMPVVGG